MADLTSLSGSGSSANLQLFARSLISTPPPGSGCTLTVSDGTSSIDVAVTNAYYGVVGTSTVSEFSTGLSNGAHARAITVGPDGAMWFTETSTHKLGQISASGNSPVITEFSLPTSRGLPNPTAIAHGPDGDLWYADGANSGIGKISTSGSGTEYAIPTSASSPTGIVEGFDGRMWFTEYDGGFGKTLGATTTSGTMTEYANLTAAAGPYGITSGSDGNLWFTEMGCATPLNIGKMTTSGTATEFADPGGANGITAGPDGALWFVNGASVGRIPASATSSSAITTYSTGITAGGTSQITTGPDGALWFTETGTVDGKSYIGRIDPSTHAITEVSFPDSGVEPTGIASGPDGAIWFTEGNGNAIGRVAIQTSSSTRRSKPPRTGTVNSTLLIWRR